MAAAASMDEPPPPGVSPPQPPSTTLQRASLYVGDLHPNVTEADLTRVFLSMGSLLSVHLCRDRVSHKSLCYAYVNFLFPYDASRALACLNHTTLRGKTMRIMWCQRDPLARKNGMSNLYVKNLGPSVNSARLEEMFGKYGKILSCKVAEENGMSKGFGFVQFDCEDSAMKALNALNDTVFEGKKLYVCKFIRKSERKDASDETFTNLYLKNLDEKVTEDFLKEKFSEHGTVCNLVIMKDDEGKSKGFGFVKFSLHEEAKKAVECLNGSLLGSKNLFVGRAQRRAERKEILKQEHEFMHKNNYAKSKASNLFVKNLNVSFGERELEEFFSAYGKVTSAKVMYNEDGVSKGFGFVCFSCPEEAKRAMDSLNGTTVRGMVLYVALAQSREERLRQLQSCQARYPKQPFHTSYGDILVPQYHPLYYNIPPPPPPPISLPHFSSFPPRLYPSFSRSVSGLFPFEEQRLQGEFSTRPKKFTTSYGSTQDPDIGPWKQHKPSSKLVSKSIYGAVTTSTTGSGSVHPPIIGSTQKPNIGSLKLQKPSSKLGNKGIYSAAETSTTRLGSVNSPIRTSSQWISKKNFGKMLQPLVKNTQPGNAAKKTGVLVEMNMQELLNSQNSLALNVDKAIKMMGANSGNASDSNTT